MKYAMLCDYLILVVSADYQEFYDSFLSFHGIVKDLILLSKAHQTNCKNAKGFTPQLLICVSKLEVPSVIHKHS
jgi:translation elongation factor EF-1alpha